MSAQDKKRYYNRVRRTCLKHNIEIQYQGVPPKTYSSVELVKDGSVMFADRSNDGRPLNIDWERLYNEMLKWLQGGVQ